MYLSHYNLVEKPFQITTDPKFLWLGEKHQEALAMLKYGVINNKGFLLLTGDVGTGKTTLINALLRDLDSNTIVATIVDPNLERLEFFSLLAMAFKIGAKVARKVDFLTSFTRFLNAAHLNQKRVLLIIDEAQKLTTELLEEIRALSNIEKENAKLLNIFFVGQNEFAETLTEKHCRALRQRITITYQIEPLTESETAEYIKYRLKVAGTEKEIFKTKAIRKIYAFSHGYPRLINIISDHALLTGYVRGLKRINVAIIKECAKELTIPGETRSNQPQALPLTGKQARKPLRRAGLAACLLFTVALCGYLLSALPTQTLPPQGAGQDRGESRETNRPPVSMNSHAADRFISSIEPGTDYSTGPKRSQADRANIPILKGARGDTVVAEEENTTNTARENVPTIVQRVRKTKGLEPLLSGDRKLIIPFRYNHGELQGEAFDTLDRLAPVMLENLDIEIVVKAYTDTSGTALFNKELSELRAKTVKSYLVAKGISPLRIQTISMGEKNPLQPNTTVAGRAANRRVEIEVQQ